MTPLLEVAHLSIAFKTPSGRILAVDDVSFTVGDGGCLGVVGESGAGKSQILNALMGLLPRNARAQGSIRFQGRELLGVSERALNQERGKNIGMIFQDPLSALTPHIRIGEQIVETIRVHEGVSRRAARTRALSLFEEVGVPDAKSRLRAFPHQLSGGQCQRAMIAMAIACGPALLIADEPTTALDVTIQAQILDLLKRLRSEHGTAIVLVSHDLGAIAEMAEDLLVMYGGRVVEQGPLAQTLGAPAHPYARGLIGATPRLDTPVGALTQIPGHPPLLRQRPVGCSFIDRCPARIAPCTNISPELIEFAFERRAACHLVSAL